MSVIVYWLVISIHVVVSLVLIAVILLQAGRGGGLSETFGGSATQTILGTKTSVFLKRATAASAIIYILTCLTLAVLTSHQGRSLITAGSRGLPVSGAAFPLGQESQPPLSQPFSDASADY